MEPVESCLSRGSGDGTEVKFPFLSRTRICTPLALYVYIKERKSMVRREIHR